MVRMYQCHKGTFLQRENQLFMWRELYTQVLALQGNSFKWVNQSHLRIQYLVNKLLPGVRFLDCIRLLDAHQKLLPAKWRAAVQSWLAGHARIVPQIVHQRITSKLDGPVDFWWISSQSQKFFWKSTLVCGGFHGRWCMCTAPSNTLVVLLGKKGLELAQSHWDSRVYFLEMIWWKGGPRAITVEIIRS